MRKLLLILAMAMKAGLPAYGQDKTPEPTTKRDNPKNKANPVSQIGSPPIAGASQTASIDKATTEGDKNGQESNSHAYLCAMIAPNNLPNVILAMVGIGGIIVAVCTLKKIDAQTRAIARQAELMQAQMTQWVSVSNWRANLAERTSPLSQQPRTLSVDFDVLNESNFPLTMRARFAFLGNLANRAQLHTGGDRILFPRKPLTMTLHLYLTEDQSGDYVAVTALRIAVHGQISHVGVAKEQSPLMTIRGNLVCGVTIPVPYLELESIRLIPIDPIPRKSFIERLRLRWERAPEETNNQSNDPN